MYATVERLEKPLTFEEFLTWDDGSGRDFELHDGYPMPISDPNANHEYWVVDYAGFGGIRFIGKPKQPTNTVYTLIDGEYQPKQFRRGDPCGICEAARIESLIFPELQLTAEQVFAMAR
jgi:Putative restriction endonuclease